MVSNIRHIYNKVDENCLRPIRTIYGLVQSLDKLITSNLQTALVETRQVLLSFIKSKGQHVITKFISYLWMFLNANKRTCIWYWNLTGLINQFLLNFFQTNKFQWGVVFHSRASNFVPEQQAVRCTSTLQAGNLFIHRAIMLLYIIYIVYIFVVFGVEGQFVGWLCTIWTHRIFAGVLLC